LAGHLSSKKPILATKKNPEPSRLRAVASR
jgi:hypothetical protein